MNRRAEARRTLRAIKAMSREVYVRHPNGNRAQRRADFFANAPRASRLAWRQRRKVAR